MYLNQFVRHFALSIFTRINLQHYINIINSGTCRSNSTQFSWLLIIWKFNHGWKHLKIHTAHHLDGWLKHLKKKTEKLMMLLSNSQLFFVPKRTQLNTTVHAQLLKKLRPIGRNLPISNDPVVRISRNLAKQYCSSETTWMIYCQKAEVWHRECSIIEVLLGILGIKDNWQNNFRDKGFNWLREL